MKVVTFGEFLLSELHAARSHSSVEPISLKTFLVDSRGDLASGAKLSSCRIVNSNTCS